MKLKPSLARSTECFCLLAILAGMTRSNAAESAPNTWVKATEGKSGRRTGSSLVWASDLKKMLLLGGSVKKASHVQAFDPAAGSWSDVPGAAPKVRRGLSSYYQTTYDPSTRTVYCLAGGSTMFSFSLAEKKWKQHPPAPELSGLSWLAMACDTKAKRLVVVGSDKKVGNVGWMRTVFYDIATGKWSTLPVPGAKVVKQHKDLVEAAERTIDLVGRIRLSWYRDPKGIGTEAELKALQERCGKLKGLIGMSAFKADVDGVIALLKGKKTLSALKAARAMQRKIEDRCFEQYPVPRSRRNSPLVFDARNNVCVLFGGDHEDYLMNDTWVLDLASKQWRRAAPKLAPSPRAGHALCYLPKSGKLAMYEGYAQSSSTDYGAASYWPLNPLELWLYDVKGNRWGFVGGWSHPSRKKTVNHPVPCGMFYGYSAQFYSPPALAADAEDRLVLAAHPGRVWFFPWSKVPTRTWTMRLDATRFDAAERTKRGKAPNLRRYRVKSFVASYCEVEAAPRATNVDKLPANKWVRLPAPPRNPCRGCRGRTWGTYVWDSDREQILLWGGGHCIRSSSVVSHYSPVSGRLVDAYDADEPYGANGGGGYDSSLLNRPWISVHNYNHYAYDPVAKLLVTSRGYLYDPDRMDWLRTARVKRPFSTRWGSTLCETTPYGAVAWARKAGGGGFGLWLFGGKEKGWTDLKPKGKLRGLYCDSEGACYDSKRDRLLMGFGGGYGKKGDGRITFFDFKTKVVDDLRPENKSLGIMSNTREMVYVPEADILLFGSDPYRVGGGRKGRTLTRVYDCGKNKYMLLDAGSTSYGNSSGWMYDAKRKNVYVINSGGQVWALHIDAKSLKLLDKAPGS
jgi:Galactose oxidase, central domain